VFGFILLFAGLIGGGLLFVQSLRWHDQAVESFARAEIGCTTTLDFSETGTFYVYRETQGTFEPAEGDCRRAATPGQEFDVELDGPGAVTLESDTSISYDTGEFTGTSVYAFELTESGSYEMVVRGDDVDSWAAVGRDPSERVPELRRNALVVAAAGVVLGGLLLALAGMRSKRASTPTIPDGPGWGHRPNDGVPAWPPAPPRVPQVPVNPHQPDTPAAPAAPPPPLPARAPGFAAPTRSPWAPPSVDTAPVDTAPPGPVPTARPPELPPKLPD
jgi:hypothetical protein